MTGKNLTLRRNSGIGWAHVKSEPMQTRGDFALTDNIWQNLETYLIVTTVAGATGI